MVFYKDKSVHLLHLLQFAIQIGGQLTEAVV